MVNKALMTYLNNARFVLDHEGTSWTKSIQPELERNILTDLESYTASN